MTATRSLERKYGNQRRQEDYDSIIMKTKNNSDTRHFLLHRHKDSLSNHARRRRRHQFVWGLQSSIHQFKLSFLLCLIFYNLMTNSKLQVVVTALQHRQQVPFAPRRQQQRSTGTFPRTNNNNIFVPTLFRSSTRLHVLTTPESIIEQASTKRLLDDLIDESVRTSARRPIIMQFNPSSGWIWKRWKGTVFSETWDSCVYRMLFAAAVYLLCQAANPQMKSVLSGFNTLWGQLLSVTTFTLTFFVNQSYALWRKCTELSRRLQGRLHDLDMTLAAHAARKPSTNPNEPSTYTAGSRQLLELISRYVRLFNLLTYASFTRSHRPILTPRGMRRLVERGLMTPIEREILINCEIPATQRHNAVLLWIIRAFIEGHAAGHFIGGDGFEQQFIEKAHVGRASYGGIGDELQGRMPLAYAHIVQVLVDIVLWMYPFMAYSSGMSGFLCVVGTGLLTVGYQGLFDLAKQFLDPYDNENFGKGEDPLVVDTLIAETNAGSIRWMNGLEEFPVANQRIRDGELSDFLLPLRGHSVEELEQMEAEKRELKALREKEEYERRRAEEHERYIRKAAEAMIPASYDNVLKSNSTSISSETTTYTYLPATRSAEKFGKKVDAVSTAKIMSMAKMIGVANTLQEISNISSVFPPSIIPLGTALASDYKEETAIAALPELPTVEEITKDKLEVLDEVLDDIYEEEQQPTTEYLDGIGDEDDDAEFEVLQDWGSDDTYIHEYDDFDPFNDIEWHDQVGPDGQEIRLSQLLADEEWPEEIDAAREKAERIRTYEEYTKRVSEIKDAQRNELRETQEILNASPGTDMEMSERIDTDYEVKYDQTQLDGISQLWGMPPDDLSDLPVLKELGVPPAEIGGITQMWDAGCGKAPGSSSEEDFARDGADDVSFDGISQLWGESIGGPAEDNLSASATRRIANEESDPSYFVSNDDKREFRLSEILADEVWSEPERPSLEDSFSFEDYEKQVAEILEAEREEMLETEAIMNAPPGADSIESLENYDHEKDDDEDQNDLSVLEMDEEPKGDSDAFLETGASSNRQTTSAIKKSSKPPTAMSGKQDSTASVDTTVTASGAYDNQVAAALESGEIGRQETKKEKEERLETEAIMNAPPAANSVDFPKVQTEEENYGQIETESVRTEPPEVDSVEVQGTDKDVDIKALNTTESESDQGASTMSSASSQNTAEAKGKETPDLPADKANQQESKQSQPEDDGKILP